MEKAIATWQTILWKCFRRDLRHTKYICSCFQQAKPNHPFLFALLFERGRNEAALDTYFDEFSLRWKVTRDHVRQLSENSM